MKDKLQIKEKLQIIVVCLVVFLCTAGFMFLKVQAFNGDPDCLFVKCVKVK